MAEKKGNAGKEGKKLTFKTSIDIPSQNRGKIIAILNRNLADALVLYSQTKQAHWNVKGETFYQLHELFDDIAEGVLGWVDLIAERATALGGYAEGTVRMAASETRLPPYPTDKNSGKAHVKNLVGAFSIFAKNVRKAIDETADLEDLSTSDLFTEVSRDADKYLWFLEAHEQ